MPLWILLLIFSQSVPCPPAESCCRHLDATTLGSANFPFVENDLLSSLRITPAACRLADVDTHAPKKTIAFHRRILDGSAFHVFTPARSGSRRDAPADVKIKTLSNPADSTSCCDRRAIVKLLPDPGDACNMPPPVHASLMRGPRLPGQSSTAV